MEAIERMAALCMKDPDEEEEGDDDEELEDDLMVRRGLSPRGSSGLCASVPGASFLGIALSRKGAFPPRIVADETPGASQAELQEVLGKGEGSADAPAPPAKVRHVFRLRFCRAGAGSGPF